MRPDLRRTRRRAYAKRPRYPGQVGNGEPIAAKVTRLRTAPTRTLRTAAEAFLDTIGPANTRRS
ncbi:hypothetical protein [Nocardia miyunensis]|uniref:hypothetical protein n=1 Tax=Nocardia miyunensis TaxID=282684 RepID=UPI000A77FA38|nr:hypothetical protein [Nocardia miyunensis]